MRKIAFALMVSLLAFGIYYFTSRMIDEAVLVSITESPMISAEIGVTEIGVTEETGDLPIRTTSPATLTPNQAIVTAVEALNVRAGPAESNRILFELLAGSIVEIAGKCTADGWIEIVYQGKHGWVNADYLNGGFCQ